MTHNENFNLDELPEELKGDIIPEIDPAKLFDEKEYATLIIGGDDGSKKDIQNADFISIIINNKGGYNVLAGIGGTGNNGNSEI